VKGSTGPRSAVVPLEGRRDAAAWLSARTAVQVVPIRHPVIEALGHQPTSDYAEQFWLPIIGPGARWAHRRLTAGLLTDHSGYVLDLATLGRQIGLGAGTGRNSSVVRTLARLVDFHLAEIVDDRLGVSTSLRPLTRRQAARLPDHLARRHRDLTRHHDDSPHVVGLSAEVGR
jgi:hypothetical protein